MSDHSAEQAGVGEEGSSADFAQPTPEYTDDTTGYPEADREFTRDDPAEEGADPRPEK